MYLSLFLLPILEKRPVNGKFNLASKSKSKLFFPFPPKRKVLAPISPGSDLAALRAEAALSLPASSDLFKTLYLSAFMSFKVGDTFFVQGFEHTASPAQGRASDTCWSRREGAASFLVPLGISMDISFLKASLYYNIIFLEAWRSCCYRPGLRFDIGGGISLRDASGFCVGSNSPRILVGPRRVSLRSAIHRQRTRLPSAAFSSLTSPLPFRLVSGK